MYNVNFNISGDLHIHLGNDILDSIFPDELAEDEAENETEIEDYETDEIAPSGPADRRGAIVLTERIGKAIL